MALFAEKITLLRQHVFEKHLQKRIKQTSIRKECDLNVLLNQPKCTPAKIVEERNLIMRNCSCINGGLLLITNPVLKKKIKTFN